RDSWAARSLPARSPLGRGPGWCFLLPSTEDELERRAGKAEGAAQLVLQEAAVAEVDELRIIDEENEGGRVHARLRRVEDLERLAALHRGVAGCDHLNERVELGRTHAALAL